MYTLIPEEIPATGATLPLSPYRMLTRDPSMGKSLFSLRLSVFGPLRVSIVGHADVPLRFWAHVLQCSSMLFGPVFYVLPVLGNSAYVSTASAAAVSASYSLSLSTQQRKLASDLWFGIFFKKSCTEHGLSCKRLATHTHRTQRR